MEFQKLDPQNPEPLYLQIAGIIEQKIVSKEIELEEKLPTEENLSRIFNVSIDTVRGALLKLVEEGYLLRRQKHGTVLISQQPNKRTDLQTKINLVFCFPGASSANIDPFTHPYFSKILKGVEEEAQKKGFQLVYNIVNTAESVLEHKKDTAGVIIAGAIAPVFLKMLKKGKTPFVLIGDVFRKEITDPEIDVISSNDFESTYTITSHLTGLGHKKIAYIAPFLKRYSWEIEQLKGYRQALRDAGLGCSGELEVETGKNVFNVGYMAMKELLKKRLSFTGVVCTADVLCFGVMKAIREAGLGIPEDMSIISCGASLEMVNSFEPQLSIMTTDMKEFVKAAVDRLFEKIDSRDWQPGRVNVKRHLILHSSTAVAGAAKKIRSISGEENLAKN